MTCCIVRLPGDSAAALRQAGSTQRWLGFNAAERQALLRAVPSPDQRLASVR